MELTSHFCILMIQPHTFIMDLRRSGVNSAIPKEEATVQYTKFDDVVECCLKVGMHAYLTKTDIKSAFRNIPIAPRDHKFISFRFQGCYFVDKCLPFGLTTSCKIFEQVATALEAIARARLMNQSLDHYLDDFIGCSSGRNPTNHAINTLIQVCESVGMPIARDKTVWATQVIKFLGLLLDTLQQRIFIPDHKVQSLRRKLLHVKSSKTMRLSTLQSLMGSLNFYARVKPGGRCFIRHLYDHQKTTNPRHHINVVSEMKRDIKPFF